MRRLVAVPAVPGPELSDALLLALDGRGPAVLPVPTDPVEAARVVAAVRPDQPVEDDVCLVVPTSGSTGEPKGVLLTASCLTASAQAAQARLGGPGSWHLAIPVTHIGGLQVLLRSLLSNGEPVTGDFVAATAALGPGRRYCSLVPTQLGRLLAAGPAAVEAARSYDAVLVGAAATPAVLLEQARAAGVRVVTTYGMSETSGGCVYDGVPLAGVTVSFGEGGRVRLSGPVVARGYRLRPELTAEAFDGATFTTGDLGLLADGRLAIEGRVDDLINTGGEKVAPLAVQSALTSHPGVADVAVVGVPDPDWVERVVAVVVACGEGITLEQAREHVAQRLPRVAAPRRLRIVDELPLLASGKIDRAALVLLATTEDEGP